MRVLKYVHNQDRDKVLVVCNVPDGAVPKVGVTIGIRGFPFMVKEINNQGGKVIEVFISRR